MLTISRVPPIIAMFFVAIIFSSVAQADTASDYQKKYPSEFGFFKQKYENQNGVGYSDEMVETFSVVAENVENIQKMYPDITLGAMLALIYNESNFQRNFYNTLDSQNSYKNLLIDSSKLEYYKQPFARFSYQFGIIPIHTSNFRSCFKGAQQNRKKMDAAIQAGGFHVPTKEELNATRLDFLEVCNKPARRNYISNTPEAVDYYILNAHELFEIKPNYVVRLHPPKKQKTHPSVPDDDGAKYPFFSIKLTAPFFFDEIIENVRALRAIAKKENGGIEAFTKVDDALMICASGGVQIDASRGGDKSYCESQKYNFIMSPWIAYKRTTEGALKGLK